MRRLLRILIYGTAVGAGAQIARTLIRYIQEIF